MKKYIPLDWLLEKAEKDLTPELFTVFRISMEDAPTVTLPDDGVLAVRSALVPFDSVETYPDCTVQVLTHSETGECSVGWWRNDNPPVPFGSL